MAVTTRLDLSAATSDVHYTTHGGLFKPDYYELNSKLLEMQRKKVLPNMYVTGVLRPFSKFLVKLGENVFNRIFTRDLKNLELQERFYRRIIPDIAEALLQRDHEGFYYSSSYHDLLSFQAVVTSIYQTILDKNIQTVSRAVFPPMAKWGKERSPYTWTVHATYSKGLGLYAGIVSLPPENRNGGILAWSALGHEVAGHNFLCSNKQLLPELERHVYQNVERSHGKELAKYWSRCVEETTSDILGVLNIGPVFAAALIGYFRGFRGGELRTTGIYPGSGTTKKTLRLYSNPAGKMDMTVKDLPTYVKLPERGGFLGKVDDAEILFDSFFAVNEKHPVDLLRPFVLLEVIDALEGLNEETKGRWKGIVEEEAHKDRPDHISVVEIDAESPASISHKLDTHQAIEAGKVVAKTILHTPLQALEGRPLIDIFSWTDQDEKMVEQLKTALTNNAPLSQPRGSFYARYILAAATQASLEEGANIQTIFERMKRLLLEAYNQSSKWKKGDYVKVRLKIPEEPGKFAEPRYYFGGEG